MRGVRRPEKACVCEANQPGASGSAPFLISLSFLNHCNAVPNLNRDDGMTLRIQGSKHEVPRHLGPTGALRMLLQFFEGDQLS